MIFFHSILSLLSLHFSYCHTWNFWTSCDSVQPSADKDMFSCPTLHLCSCSKWFSRKMMWHNAWCSNCELDMSDLQLQFPKCSFNSNAKWWDNALLNLKDCHLEQCLQNKASNSITSILKQSSLVSGAEAVFITTRFGMIHYHSNIIYKIQLSILN